MSGRTNRLRLAIGLFFLAWASAIVGSFVVWLLVYRQPIDVRVFWSVRSDWDAAGQQPDEKKTDLEKDKLAVRCLEVAEDYPGTAGELSALLMAATRAENTPAGKEANRQLARRIAAADLDQFDKAFDRAVRDWKPLRNLAPDLLARARQDPDHPKAARLLAAVCAATKPEEDGTPPAIYAEAADLIADKHAASPHVAHFCEGLRSGASWTLPFERHLRAVVEVNPDRCTRCAASFALASVVQANGEGRQAEAEALFGQFLKEFDGQHRYHAKGIEEQYRFEAQRQVGELRSRAIGMLAPEIAGIDLDGKPMKLSDYRGRVVLMNFWATWCFPCMKLIPHEVALAKTFQGQPFDIVGINCDTNIPGARAAAARTGMTWRSFRDQVNQKPTVTTDWKVVGFPALYLIDHHGTIRKRWIGYPPPDELAHLTRVLVDAARRNVPAGEMTPVVAALAMPAKKAEPVVAPAPGAARPGLGFVEKVYRAPDGSESNYTVFVPHAYDGTKAFPVVLSLHGAGSRGTDGQGAVKYGLAKFVREKGDDFPFLVVFPQAQEGEDWTAESAGGRRALAILDRVQRDYRTDADRVVLTGVSMGGQGTWSLAAADPARWAAIVPVCHGGDANSAPRLKDTPCWCFHGDADKMIPVQQSRDMVRAVQDAGGRPLYQEFPGVGHNDCPDRAYALPDLWEWMLLQNRTRR